MINYDVDDRIKDMYEILRDMKFHGTDFEVSLAVCYMNASYENKLIIQSVFYANFKKYGYTHRTNN